MSELGNKNFIEEQTTDHLQKVLDVTSGVVGWMYGCCLQHGYLISSVNMKTSHQLQRFNPN